MSFFALIIILSNTLLSGLCQSIHNGERFSMSLGDFNEDFDDLEIIQENKNNWLLNENLKEFHNFVKNFKTVKHPWEKFSIKSTEYRKSKLLYQKLMQDIVNKMKDFNRQARTRRNNIFQFIKLNTSLVGKRQLPERVDNRETDNDNDDDDDDDDDEDNDIINNEKTVSNQEFTNLKNKYLSQIIKNEENSKIFKYSDEGKPEENIKEAFDKIIDIKTPENCSNITGFGIKSVKCLVKKYKTDEMTAKEAFIKFIKIFSIWIDIYLCVAIPLWCIKGWGCCCFRCDFCRPRKIIKDVQIYIYNNPPGVYINEEGEEEHYAASVREKQLYEKMNKTISHF